MKMDDGNFLNQIIYIKYKEEDNVKKALLGMKAQENIAAKTTIEERIIDMTKGVGEEHIYESPKHKGRHHTSSDDKKSTTRNIEVPTRSI